MECHDGRGPEPTRNYRHLPLLFSRHVHPITLEAMGTEAAIGMGLDFHPIWYILLSEPDPATLKRKHGKGSWTILSFAISCCVTLGWSIYLSELHLL